MTQNIELDLADYVVAEIAIVDGAGAVVHCNRKWEETAKTGGLLPKQPGWNYIAECEAAIQRDCDVAEILAGLRAVLRGEAPFLCRDLRLSIQWAVPLVSGADFGNRNQG